MNGSPWKFRLDDANNLVFDKSKQSLVRAYIYSTPTDRIALSADYFLEKFDREPGLQDDALRLLTTHRVPLSVSYHAPGGLFASITATYINQDVEVDEQAAGDSANASQGIERFWLVDASLGYRFPKRLGIATLGVLNLLDQEFRFQDTRFASNEPISPLFQPDRAIFVQFTLAY